MPLDLILGGRFHGPQISVVTVLCLTLPLHVMGAVLLLGYERSALMISTVNVKNVSFCCWDDLEQSKFGVVRAYRRSLTFSCPFCATRRLIGCVISEFIFQNEGALRALWMRARIGP